MPNLSVLVTEYYINNFFKTGARRLKQTAARKQFYMKQSTDVRLYAL